MIQNQFSAQTMTNSYLIFDSSLLKLTKTINNIKVSVSYEYEGNRYMDSCHIFDLQILDSPFLEGEGTLKIINLHMGNS